MNERLKELLEQATEVHDYWYTGKSQHMVDYKMFAELIVRECVNTLEFHGFDDAVPYIKWMATNKLGVEK